MSLTVGGETEDEFPALVEQKSYSVVFFLFYSHTLTLIMSSMSELRAAATTGCHFSVKGQDTLR